MATTLFADRGFAAVTTREIAKTAGVAFPVMYRHFHDKRTLYLTAFGSALARVDAKYISLMMREGPPEARLFAFVSELYKDLVSDPFVSKYMQREILDRDHAGFKKLTKNNFLEPFHMVKEHCGKLVGETAAEWTAILIYSVTMGCAQFRPIGQIIARDRVRWRNPDFMARVILMQVLPKIDWSLVNERLSTPTP